MTLRGRKFRLYPTPKQEKFLTRQFGSCRFVYNHFLALRKQTFEETGKSPATLTCVKQLVFLKAQNPWLKEVNAQSLQSSVINLGFAFDRFFKKLGDYPKFKSKYNGHQSFFVPQHFKLNGNKVFIPKLVDGIDMVQHRPLGGTPKSVVIRKVPSGKYFVTVLCEIKPKPLPKLDTVVGVDVGISRLATISDGQIISNPRFMEHSLKKLTRASRSFSRKRKVGKNREKAKLRLAKIYEHIANQRADYLHKVSRRLVNENQVIGLEDLNIVGMLKNHCLARVLQDMGLGEFKRQILYKAEEVGRTVIQADRWFASSKICHVCGYVNNDLKLSDRIWTCPKCGTVHDRDDNASQNLKQEGIAGLCENRKVKPSKRLPPPWRRRSTKVDLRDSVKLAGSLKQETIRNHAFLDAP